MEKDKNIKYKLKNSYKAKSIRLAIYPDKNIVVTKPFFCSKKMVDKFLKNKRPWIEKKLKQIDALPKRPHYSKKHYLENKEKARYLINNKLEYYSNLYNFKYNRVSIRSQKTRWGSCSKNNNLNFNYKIILLPEHLQDYIIIHELCHLIELNHSKKFWLLVEKICPNYVECKRQLKKYNI